MSLKPSSTSHLKCYAQTHAGMKGKQNEDRYRISAFKTDDDKSSPVVLAVLSDGIGGHRAGEIAAQIAVDTITYDMTAADISDPIFALRKSIQNASAVIYSQSQDDPQQYGMGATCACVLMIGDVLYTASVGDSRIYLIKKNTIQQLSIDHTWLEESIQAGILTKKEAIGHPNAHILRRYLGSLKPPEPDFRLHLRPNESDAVAIKNQGLTLNGGDLVYLCTDGLSDLVNINEINEHFRKFDPQTSIESLTELANQRGGHDNITQIVLEVPGKSGKHTLKRKIAWIAATLLLVIALAGLHIASELGLIKVKMPWEAEPNPTGIPALIFPTAPGEDDLESNLPLPQVTRTGRPSEPGLQPDAIATPIPTLVNKPPEPTVTLWPTNTQSPNYP